MTLANVQPDDAYSEFYFGINHSFEYVCPVILEKFDIATGKTIWHICESNYLESGSIYGEQFTPRTGRITSGSALDDSPLRDRGKIFKVGDNLYYFGGLIITEDTKDKQRVPLTRIDSETGEILERFRVAESLSPSSNRSPFLLGERLYWRTHSFVEETLNEVHQDFDDTFPNYILSIHDNTLHMLNGVYVTDFDLTGENKLVDSRQGDWTGDARVVSQPKHTERTGEIILEDEGALWRMQGASKVRLSPDFAVLNVSTVEEVPQGWFVVRSTGNPQVWNSDFTAMLHEFDSGLSKYYISENYCVSVGNFIQKLSFPEGELLTQESAPWEDTLYVDRLFYHEESDTIVVSGKFDETALVGIDGTSGEIRWDRRPNYAPVEVYDTDLSKDFDIDLPLLMDGDSAFVGRWSSIPTPLVD